MTNRLLEKQLVNEDPGGTGVVDGSTISCAQQKGWTFAITSTLVTSGATLAIQAEMVGGWVTIHEEVVTTNDTVVVRDEYGHYDKLRVNVTAYTDGTYGVKAMGSWVQ